MRSTPWNVIGFVLARDQAALAAKRRHLDVPAQFHFLLQERIARLAVGFAFVGEAQVFQGMLHGVQTTPRGDGLPQR